MGTSAIYIVLFTHAATLPTPVPASSVIGITVGNGFVEASARQVVRTAGNVVYVITSDDDSCQNGGAGVIHVWKGTGTQAANAQVPTSFVEQDAANRPKSNVGDCTFNSSFVLFSPDSRLDPSGIINLAYIDGASASVYFQTFSTLTNTWGSRSVIGTGAETTSGGGWPRGGHVALTLDGTNQPQVVYMTGGTANKVMFTSRSSGSWSTPQQISSGTNAMHPSMVTATDGSLHLAWMDNSLASHSAIKYANRVGGAWGAVETVSAGDNLVLNNADDDQGPSIVTNTSGNPYVLYMDGTGSASTTDNFVRQRFRTTAGVWQDDSPPGNLFAHTPQNYLSSTNDIFVFLGHDINIQFGYQYQLGGIGNGWSSYSSLDPRNQNNTTAGAPGLDGSASVRFDPLRDNNPGIIDVLYFDESDGAGPGHHATVFYKAIVLSGGTPPPPPTCTRAADINCDGSVNIQDVTVVLSNFGKPVAQASDPRADTSGNGTVDIPDMTVVLSAFGS
jgi:hypothetical protein